MQISSATIRAMQEHARAEYPREACGFVADGEYLPQVNTADDPEKGFSVALAAYLGLAGRIEAVVHSHPARAGEHVCPSSADMRAQMSAAVPWGIVPVVEGEPGEPIWWGDSLPIRDLVGRPFVHGVWDCYGLIRDYYRLEGRGALPQIPRDNDWWDNGGDLYAEGLKSTPGVRVIPREEVAPGDMIFFKIRSTRTNHAGVYLGDGLILHHLHGKLSGREEVSRWMRFATHFARYDGGAA